MPALNERQPERIKCVDDDVHRSLTEMRMTAIPIATVVLLIVSCLLAMRAAAYPIRNSIDDFIDDLNRQGRWATAAAVCAFGVAVLEAVRLLF